MSQDDVACPTCGQNGFDDRSAMLVHHGLAHSDEPLPPNAVCDYCGGEYHVPERKRDASRWCSQQCREKAWTDRRQEVVCENCDDEFRPSASRDNPTFCSKGCQLEALRSGHWSGRDNPRWRGGDATVECDVCGDSFQVVQSRVEEARFCSRSCRGEHLREQFSGEDNPRWAGGPVSLECEECGEQYEVVPARENLSRWCSRECQATAYEGLTGQENNNWRGGETLYFALLRQLGERSWGSIRDECLASDCKLCGGTAGTLHHIVPLKAGGTNEPWNLMSLCRSCHSVVESYTHEIVEYPLLPNKSE